MDGITKYLGEASQGRKLLSFTIYDGNTIFFEYFTIKNLGEMRTRVLNLEQPENTITAHRDSHIRNEYDPMNGFSVQGSPTPVQQLGRQQLLVRAS